MPGLRLVHSLWVAAAQAGSQAAPGEAHPTGEASARGKTSCTWNEKVPLIPKGKTSYWAITIPVSRNGRNVEEEIEPEEKSQET